MRAIRINRYGGPEVLRLTELAIPVSGPAEVLVKVANAGVNFMDIHPRQGKYKNSRSYPVSVPLTLGMEGAGVVQAVGPNVARLRPGMRVAWCISWGSYAEYASVQERLAATIPDEIGFDQAAATMFQGTTAHYLINDVGHLAPA